MTKYVLKSNYDTKVGNLELRIPDVSGLLQTSVFNSKISELENKIKTAESKPDIRNLASKTEVTNVKNLIPDSNAFVKKKDYATEITKIRNKYVTDAALTSQLNDLKNQSIADKIKKVDDKVSKNSTREASFFRESHYFNQQFYLIYEPKAFFLKQTAAGITHWKSTGIDNYSLNTDLRGVANTLGVYPKVSGGTRMNVKFSGNYFKENNSIYPIKSVVNIYIVYSLDPIKSTRNTDFTIQNALFGAVKIKKDVNPSNNKYVGCGTFFDEGSDFTAGNITNCKNVIFFDCDMSSSIYSTNRLNNIYGLGKSETQGINGTAIYAEKIYKHKFTEPN